MFEGTYSTFMQELRNTLRDRLLRHQCVRSSSFHSHLWFRYDINKLLYALLAMGSFECHVCIHSTLQLSRDHFAKKNNVSWKCEQNCTNDVVVLYAISCYFVQRYIELLAVPRGNYMITSSNGNLFPRYWAFTRRIQRPVTRNVEFLLLSTSKQTVETSVIWDAIVLMMTSL